MKEKARWFRRMRRADFSPMKPGTLTHTIAVIISSITSFFTHSAPAKAATTKMNVSKKTDRLQDDSFPAVDTLAYLSAVRHDPPKHAEHFPWKKEIVTTVFWIGEQHGQPTNLELLSDFFDPERMDMALLCVELEHTTGHNGKKDFSLSKDGQLERYRDGMVNPVVYAGAIAMSPSLFDDAPFPWSRTVRAVHALEDAVTKTEGLEGIVLRYGAFYGPGASDVLLEMLRKRQVPVVGGGTGVWSFVEITDAAAATLAAIDRGAPGLYNVVDSDPAPVAEWLPYLAQVAGAKPPLRVPAWVGRLLAGEFVVAQMTTSRGYSNEKARKELGWEPRYASWREGFRAWVGG